MRFVSFASSSKGNCTLISYKNTNILVDCGITKKKLVEGLENYGLTLSDIRCIFITHEHSDHISGLPTILSKNDITIVSQRDTLIKVSELCEDKGIKVNAKNFRIINSVNILNENSYFNIGDIKVYPLKGCHDVPALYYKFVLGDTVVAILTDMGAINDYNIRTLQDVNYLMLECNYDENLLFNCGYPPYLINRIIGKGGHLSNVDCANIIMNIANDGLKEVYLSHISNDSNSEEYAYEFVKHYLDDNYKSDKKLPVIRIAKRLDITEIINSEK